MDASPPPSLLAVAAAWPAAVAQPSSAAAYERALEGLDPGAVEAAVASLSRDGRPAPAPGMLRAVVLARATAPRAAAPVEAAPSIGRVRPAGTGSAGIPPEGQRAWRFLWISALLSVAAGLMQFAPWLVIEVAGAPGISISPGAIDAGGVVKILVLALAAIVLGRSYLRQSRPARHVRGAFCLSAVLGALGALGVAFTIPVIRDIQEQGAGVPGVEVSMGPGMWAALGLHIAGMVTAVWGLVVLTRGPGAWRGSDAYLPPRWQRWAGRAGATVCIALVALIAAGLLWSPSIPSDQATNDDVAALGASKATARRAEAGNAYVRVLRDTNSRMEVAYAALDRALAAGDTAGIARSVRTHIAISTRARARLVRTVRAPADAQPAVDGMAFALTRQIGAYKALANQLERYGTIDDDAIGAVTAAENATADAAARVAAALGVSTSPL